MNFLVFFDDASLLICKITIKGRVMNYSLIVSNVMSALGITMLLLSISTGNAISCNEPGICVGCGSLLISDGCPSKTYLCENAPGEVGCLASFCHSCYAECKTVPIYCTCSTGACN